MEGRREGRSEGERKEMNRVSVERKLYKEVH